MAYNQYIYRLVFKYKMTYYLVDYCSGEFFKQGKSFERQNHVLMLDCVRQRSNTTTTRMLNATRLFEQECITFQLMIKQRDMELGMKWALIEGRYFARIISTEIVRLLHQSLIIGRWSDIVALLTQSFIKFKSDE